MLELDDILTECEKSEFRNIRFDYTKVINNKQLCEEFFLDVRERVIAYHFRKKGFTSKIDIIFTNKGIHSSNLEQILNYEKLSDYIITSTNLAVDCLLFSKTGTIELTQKGFVDTFREKSDEELIVFVEAIQKCLRKKDAGFNNRYLETEKWFLDTVKQDVNGEYYYSSALKRLSRDSREAKLFVALLYLKEFDVEKACPLLVSEDKQTWMDLLSDVRNEYKNPEVVIPENVVKDRIKDIDASMMCNADNDTPLHAIISILDEAKLYYMIRRELLKKDHCRNIDILSILETLEKPEELLKFSFVLKNHISADYFERALLGKKADTKRVIGYEDSFGLNLFHYAIITNNAELIEFCLANEKKIPICEEEYLDYSLIAEYKGNHALALRIEEKIGSLGALLRTKTSLERYILVREGINSLAEGYKRSLQRNVKQAKRGVNDYDYAKYVKYHNALEKEKDFTRSVESDAQAIESLRQDLRELEQQIEAERIRFDNTIRARAEVFARANDVNTVSYKSLFGCNDISVFLRSFHLSNLNCEPFKDGYKFIYGDGFICYWSYTTYTEDNTGGSYQSHNRSYKNEDASSHRQQDHNTDRQNHQKNTYKANNYSRPYGNSWFSPKAHQEYSALQAEYRNLAKKYHPDSPSGSEEIFKEINNERASIMENLK